ncbi:MAG: DegV family protein [Chloroflexi bacterium]|nr:MAG: DegV family protein [Chloroflexota bacterium]RLC97141.1 MAG: DegV family protein [Chloroflexota bacterium]
MTVKIVTDSTSDLPPDIAEALGITVVPAYVRFGDRTYRDGVDITADEFYERLRKDPVHPTTSAPSPGDFGAAYKRLAKECSEIVSIVVTSKMSAVHESALLGRHEVSGNCRIEVVDSKWVSIGLGLIAMAAAEKARLGAGIEEVLETARQAISRMGMLAMLDTLRYAVRGGRLGKASKLLGAMVKVKPMITARDGIVVPAGLARTRSKGMERLYEFVKKHLPAEEIAIAHNTNREEAESLASRVKTLVPGKGPIMARVGPGLGVHGGPEALVVAVMKAKEDVQRAFAERRRKLSVPTLRLPH